MPLYRFYRITEGGRIASPPELVECPQDQAAIAEAKRRGEGQAIEIWDQTRLVGRVQAAGTPKA